MQQGEMKAEKKKQHQEERDKENEKKECKWRGQNTVEQMEFQADVWLKC